MRPSALSRLLALAPLLAAPAAADDYSGEGFAQSLVQFSPSAPSPAAAAAVVVGHLGEGALADVALLMGDTAVVCFDAAAYGRYVQVARSVEAIEVVAHAGGDVLYSTDGTTLRRHDWNGTSFVATTIGSGLGGKALHAVATDSGEPGLATLSTDGTSVGLLRYSSGAWVSDATIVADAQEQQFFTAVERLDFDGDGDLDTALVSEVGLEVVGPVPPPGAFEIDPDGAFLEVIPAAETGGGRDLLVAHGRWTVDGLWYLLVWNESGPHQEMILVGSGPADALCLADYLVGDGRPDIVVSMRDEPALYLLEHVQVAPSEPHLPLFRVPQSPLPSRVDLGVLALHTPCTPPVAGTPLGSGDLDADGPTTSQPGDVDLVLVSTCNELVVLPGAAILEEDQRPMVDLSISPTINELADSREFEYTAVVTSPAGATTLDVHVYHQPSAGASVTPAPLTTVTVAVQPGAQQVDVVVPVPQGSQDEVFQVLFEASNAQTTYPARVVHWSPDTATHQTLGENEVLVYPWSPSAQQSSGTDPGGTVRRPRIDPITTGS